MDTRKRGRGEFANGAFKKSKLEIDSLSSGIGSKSKPCTKFFSTSGCPFGENCHFLHYVPGGYNAVAQMMNLPPAQTQATVSHPAQNGSAPGSIKTKMCTKYKTAEGCKFGDKCHFAHGEWELGRPIQASQEDPRAIGGHHTGHFGGRAEPRMAGPIASFGASATTKISVDASLAGAVIGKGGVNSKQICWQTGAKLSVREHETEPNLRNIELEGTFEQIEEASAMVREIILRISSGSGGAAKAAHGGGHTGSGPGSNFKTKLCEKFSNGSCTFGDRCHFAHGAAELRKTGI